MPFRNQPLLFRAYTLGCDQAGKLLFKRYSADRPCWTRILGEPAYVYMGQARMPWSSWMAAAPEMARYWLLAGVLGTAALIGLRAFLRHTAS